MTHINYCQVHNKFQTQNGRWLDAGTKQEELHEHEKFLFKKNGSVTIMDCVCPQCEDNSQLKFDLPESNNFKELLPEYKGTFHAEKK